MFGYRVKDLPRLNSRERNQIRNDGNKDNCWKVVGDHAVLARPDKYGMKINEAQAYASSLRGLGYENVQVILDT